jgi:hypothetical protein
MGAYLFERVEVFRSSPEIVNEDMSFPLNRDLHCGYQNDAQAPGILGQITVPDVQVVASDSERVIAEFSGFRDQFLGRMGTQPVILGIQAAVGMQFGLEPALVRRVSENHDNLTPALRGLSHPSHLGH